MEKRNYRPITGERSSFRSGPPRESEETNKLIFGLRPIMEALEAGKDIEKIYLQKNI
ncbi:MAG: hypothetical protein EOO03_16155, partial [Chitinophagaceae bacterium]